MFFVSSCTQNSCQHVTVTSYTQICTDHTVYTEYFNQCHIQADRKRRAAGIKNKNFLQDSSGSYMVQKTGAQKTFTSLQIHNCNPKSVQNPKLPLFSPQRFPTAILWCTFCSGSGRRGGSSPSTSRDRADVLMDACRKRSSLTCGRLLKDDFSILNDHPG